MSDLKAIFFDFDGLLISTDELIYTALNLALEKHGCKLSEEEFGRWFGLSGEDLMKKMIEIFQLNVDWQALVAEVRSLIEYDKIELKPGAMELLKYLEGKYEILLVSNAVLETFSKKIDHLGIKQFFTKIICLGGEVAPKPAPDGYLKAATEIKLEPHDCLVLEDSEVGVKSAVGAGCQAYLVPNKYIAYPDNLGQKYGVKSISKLDDLIGVI